MSKASAMTQLAEATGLSLEEVRATFAETGNLRLENVLAILAELGFELQAVPSGSFENIER